MSGAQIHLILNHVPVIGIFFVDALLLLGLQRRSEELLRLSLAGFAVMALLTVPVFMTGDPAHETLKALPGIDGATLDAFVNPHDEMAEKSLIGVSILGVVAILGLFLYREPKQLSRRFLALVLVLALGVSAAFAWTAHLGGLIRHSELRAGVAAPAAPGGRKTGAEQSR